MRTRPRVSFPASFGSGLSAARTTRASSAVDADRAVSAVLRRPRPPDRGYARWTPTGEMQDVRAAVHLLPLRVHAIQESAGVLLQHIANSCRLNDVDPDLGAH